MQRYSIIVDSEVSVRILLHVEMHKNIYLVCKLLVFMHHYL